MKKDEEIFDKFISNNEHPLEVKNLLRIMNQPRVERKIVEILNLYSGGDKKESLDYYQRLLQWIKITQHMKIS